MLSYGTDSTGSKLGRLAMNRTPLESFHYTSQIAVGDDLLVLSRSGIGAANGYQAYHWNTGFPT